MYIGISVGAVLFILLVILGVYLISHRSHAY